MTSEQLAKKIRKKEFFSKSLLERPWSRIWGQFTIQC